MIICMVHSLTPFEILDPKTYAQYYKNFINSTQKISSTQQNYAHYAKSDDNPWENLQKKPYYFTSCMKIFQQIYFSLFCKLLGSHKTTRYQHMLCFTSELYCHIAFILKSTPRALYGTDAGEHMNDKVKVLVHRISNKFMNHLNPELPAQTIDMIMKYILYEYYHVREENIKFNTQETQKKLQNKQQSKDEETINRPAEICNYFREICNISYKLNNKQFDNIIKDYNDKYDYEYDKYDSDDSEDETKQFEHDMELDLENHLQEIQNFINISRQSNRLYNEECMFLVYIYMYNNNTYIQ